MKIGHVLDGFEKKRLAEMWCELNRWEWPKEIPNPEPRDAVERPRRTELMAYIVKRIGRRACLDEWNKDR